MLEIIINLDKKTRRGILFTSFEALFADMPEFHTLKNTKIFFALRFFERIGDGYQEEKVRSRKKYKHKQNFTYRLCRFFACIAHNANVTVIPARMIAALSIHVFLHADRIA